MPWQHRWPKGVQWARPAFCAIRRLKRLCKPRPKEPSFRIIRVDKISSATAPLTSCRKPLPSGSRTPPTAEACLPGFPPFTATLTGLSPQVQGQQFVPDTFPRRGLIINDQGELEYRSVYRIGMADPRRQSHLATTSRDTRPQGQSAPRSQRIDTHFPTSVNRHISPRSSTNIHPLPNAGSNTNPGRARGRPAPKFANTGSAGTPLREHLMPKPITHPKAENGSPSFEVDVVSGGEDGSHGR